MSFFLSLTTDGKQRFYVKDGVCSGLLKNAPVITHHSNLSSDFTSNPMEVVQVNRLPASTMLSEPAVEKTIFPDGDEAIRAQLGYLDNEVAPKNPELALVIGFSKGKIKRHSFLLGGKSAEVSIPLASLEGLGTGIDTSKQIALGLDFTAIQFSPGRKATEWMKIGEMFKDSAFGADEFAHLNLYTRWRVLEVDGGREGQARLFLALEALPLEKDLEAYDSEMIVKFKSSSNRAIPLFRIGLNWRGSNEKYKMETMPCIVLMDASMGTPTDSMIRMSMATVRDALRSGSFSESLMENKATVTSPEIVPLWARSARSLFMVESPAYEVINKGMYPFIKF